MKKAIALISAFCIFILSGCWDRKELDQIGIVYGVACDKDIDSGKLVLTAQVLRPSSLVQGGRVTESTIENITTEGDTVIETLRKTAKEFDRTLIFSHMKFFIFSEELAREGIAPYIDVLLRGREARDSIWIFVAKGTPAKNILGVKHGVDVIPGTSIGKIIKNNKERTGDRSSVSLLELVQKIFGEGISPVVGSLEINSETIQPDEEMSNKIAKTVIISGSAVFIKDKMAGFLNSEETRGVNWVLGNVKGGYIVLPSLQEKGKNVTIEITKASGKIKPEIINNQPAFHISVDIEANMVDKQSLGTEFSADRLFDEYDYIQKLAKESNKVVREEIKAALIKTQKEYKSDVLGLGSALNMKYPKKWKELKDNWSEVYKDASVSIDVNTEIKRTGQLMGSFKYPE